MWRILRTLSLGSLCLLLIYIFGSIKYADFDENAPISYPPGLTGKDQYFRGGIDIFLKLYPTTCWFFLGTESINLASHDASNPKRDLPRGYISTYLTVLCTSIATIFIGASVYPGATWPRSSQTPRLWAICSSSTSTTEQHAGCPFLPSTRPA
jgi:ethanolamine permease